MGRHPKTKEFPISEPRINDRIRVPEVRLVGPSGEQVGIVRIEVALSLAAEADLDLVEVAPDARPPVARLMDYGKFKYESAMKARDARRNQANTQLKEIRFRLKIDKHDFETKKGHVIRFLEEGDKVKVMIMFRGREQSRPEMGIRLLERLAEEITEYGTVESLPRQDGRNMTMVIGPVKKKAQAKTEQIKKREEAKAEHRSADENARAARAAKAEARAAERAAAPVTEEAPATFQMAPPSERTPAPRREYDDAPQRAPRSSGPSRAGSAGPRSPRPATGSGEGRMAPRREYDDAPGRAPRPAAIRDAPAAPPQARPAATPAAGPKPGGAPKPTAVPKPAPKPAPKPGATPKPGPAAKPSPTPSDAE